MSSYKQSAHRPERNWAEAWTLIRDNTGRHRRVSPVQFSLRTLLWLMLCVACFFGGWRLNDWKRKRELEESNRVHTVFPGPGTNRGLTLDPTDQLWPPVEPASGEGREAS